MSEELLNQFSDESVECFKTIYDIETKFVIHNSDIDLQFGGEINGITYYQLQCFSVLNERLKREINL